MSLTATKNKSLFRDNDIRQTAQARKGSVIPFDEASSVGDSDYKSAPSYKVSAITYRNSELMPEARADLGRRLASIEDMNADEIRISHKDTSVGQFYDKQVDSSPFHVEVAKDINREVALNQMEDIKNSFEVSNKRKSMWTCGCNIS